MLHKALIHRYNGLFRTPVPEYRDLTGRLILTQLYHPFGSEVMMIDSLALESVLDLVLWTDRL